MPEALAAFNSARTALDIPAAVFRLARDIVRARHTYQRLPNVLNQTHCSYEELQDRLVTLKKEWKVKDGVPDVLLQSLFGDGFSMVLRATQICSDDIERTLEKLEKKYTIAPDATDSLSRTRRLRLSLYNSPAKDVETLKKSLDSLNSLLRQKFMKFMKVHELDDDDQIVGKRKEVMLRQALSYVLQKTSNTSKVVQNAILHDAPKEAQYCLGSWDPAEVWDSNEIHYRFRAVLLDSTAVCYEYKWKLRDRSWDLYDFVIYFRTEQRNCAAELHYRSYRNLRYILAQQPNCVKQYERLRLAFELSLCFAITYFAGWFSQACVCSVYVLGASPEPAEYLLRLDDCPRTSHHEYGINEREPWCKRLQIHPQLRFALLLLELLSPESFQLHDIELDSRGWIQDFYIIRKDEAPLFSRVPLLGKVLKLFEEEEGSRKFIRILEECFILSAKTCSLEAFYENIIKPLAEMPQARSLSKRSDAMP